jgi:hypothetical protein
MRKLLLLAAIMTIPVTAADAKKKPHDIWEVSRSSDPITGATSCIVAPFDRAAGMSFTRSGTLYAFVENSSTHGVLVGVSSGGKWRVPTGTIIWRIDDRPFRTISPGNGPVTPLAMPAGATAAMQTLVEQQQRIIAAATSTSTAAAGDTARQMLREMLAGRSLLFRQADATQGFGIPKGNAQSVGMMTKGGLVPIPLDDSFRAGLTACGISDGPDTAKQ